MLKGVFSGLVCSLCGKTRRVDNSTFQVFHNDVWFCESKALRKEALYKDAPDFDDVLRTWYQETNFKASEAVTVEALDSFLERCEYASLREHHEIAILEASILLISKLEESVSVQLLETRLQELKNQIVGPAFHCENCVDTSCDDVCDWSIAFHASMISKILKNSQNFS